ncbi:MAG: [FeFe] hydrogenase H-cluster maturation GTPase HydF [Deltaproteobacteria bacterium]|nr:[FeFe] hydrogenase H-cluster maturation GTPase HydF [Deltaproteobacteria bacterium]
MRQRAPKGFRLHIGIFGRRNVGKSSLLNAVTRQQVAIVSDRAGTTTDPVEKPMELLPLGPVLFIDTAGVDDSGDLGLLRVDRTRRIFDRTDLALVVTEAGGWGKYEETLLDELTGRRIPVIVVFNQCDRAAPQPEERERLTGRAVAVVKTAAVTGYGIGELRAALIAAAPPEFVENPAIVADLVAPGEMAVLVVPIDKEAPKGRLILPQVQTIRDLLDHDAFCMVVKERELKGALERLKRAPQLVVTDSQAFLKVAADTPDAIPMTSFSILFARFRGDLTAMTEGVLAIDRLRPGDRILIAESCSHHPIADDIGRVKIPRWLTRYVGGKLEFDFVQGHDFQSDLSGYALVIHCGACTTNRREVMTRILACREQGVPITNYGLAIAHSLGALPRALVPFPAAWQIYVRATGEE